MSTWMTSLRLSDLLMSFSPRTRMISLEYANVKYDAASEDSENSDQMLKIGLVPVENHRSGAVNGHSNTQDYEGCLDERSL